MKVLIIGANGQLGNAISFYAPLRIENEDINITLVNRSQLNLCSLEKCEDCHLFVPCEHGQVRGDDGCLTCECIEPSVETGNTHGYFARIIRPFNSFQYLRAGVKPPGWDPFFPRKSPPPREKFLRMY